MLSGGMEIDEPLMKTELLWLPGPTGDSVTPAPNVPREIRSSGCGDWLPNGQVLLQTRVIQLGAKEATELVVNRQ